jgi:hypothetical protein
MHEYSLRAVIDRKWFKIVPIQIPFLHFICMFDNASFRYKTIKPDFERQNPSFIEESIV